MAREYRKCGTCSQVRHEMMFPWVDADATLPDPRTRTVKAEPVETYAKRYVAAQKARHEREAEVRKRRIAAQALGRSYTACLPCVNGDGGL